MDCRPIACDSSLIDKARKSDSSDPERQSAKFGIRDIEKPQTHYYYFGEKCNLMCAGFTYKVIKDRVVFTAYYNGSFSYTKTDIIQRVKLFEPKVIIYERDDHHYSMHKALEPDDRHCHLSLSENKMDEKFDEFVSCVFSVASVSEKSTETEQCIAACQYLIQAPDEPGVYFSNGSSCENRHYLDSISEGYGFNSVHEGPFNMMTSAADIGY